MGWTTPRDWANGNVPSGGDFNVHIRDNEKYLKAVFDGGESPFISFTGGSLAVSNNPNTDKTEIAIFSNTNSEPSLLWVNNQGASKYAQMRLDSAGIFHIRSWVDSITPSTDWLTLVPAAGVPSYISTLVPIRMIDGSATAPALTFASEPGFGFYRAAAGVMRINGTFAIVKDSAPTFSMNSANADNVGNISNFYKSRGTIAAPADVANGDNIWNVTFYAWVNTAYRIAAGLVVRPLSINGDVPSGAIEFSTTRILSTPTVTLQLYDGRIFANSAASGTQPHYSYIGDEGTGIGRSATNTLRFLCGFTETMRMALGGGSVPQLGFYGATPVAKPGVAGSRGGNGALTELLNVLSSLGLITNNTVA